MRSWTEFQLDDAVPLFLLLVALELGYSWWRGKGWYRANDTVSSLSAGTMSTLYGLRKSLSAAPYALLREALPMTYDLSPGSSVLRWAVLLFLVDGGYYFFHRAAHENTAMWGTHVAHHSSEQYNFSTALRQGGLESWVSWVFYLPLSVVLPVREFMALSAINIAFQFFVHTRAVGKLPAVVEFVFNTPSHHRVHHARNPRYIDANYAGMFVLWDRMFGTYVEEELEEPPVYGLVHPLRTFNPLRVQFHHLLDVFSLRNVRYWFHGPAWTPEGDLPLPPIDDEEKRPVYDPPTPYLRYVLFHFLVFSLPLHATWQGDPRDALLLLWHLVAYGYLLEGAIFIHPMLEIVRPLVTFARLSCKLGGS